MFQVSVKDAKLKLEALIQAAQNGEDIFIISDNQQRFKIVPVTTSPKRRKAGSAKGQIEIADDFDAPVTYFPL